MREGHRLLLAGDRAGDRAHSGQPAATRPGDRGLEDHTKSPGAGLRANEGLPKGTHQAQRTPNGGSKAIQAINGRTRHYHHRNRRVEALLRPNSRGNLLPVPPFCFRSRSRALGRRVRGFWPRLRRCRTALWQLFIRES